jgi:hypothetical protein
MATTTAPTAPQRTMQGLAIPAESVSPPEFFALTRRHTLLEKSFSYNGQSQDVVELRKADILAGIDIEFVGQVVTVKGTGTVATLGRWPYDILKNIKFSANGQSNIINVSGLKLKVRDVMKKSDQSDRGVTQQVNGVSVSNGTLSEASESWGLGSQATAIADGTYNVDLMWHVPIAEDEIDLMGAIFLATSSSDLTLTLEYASPADLFGLVAPATATVTGTFKVTSTKYSVPIGHTGQIVVPDLSMFHSLIQSRYTSLQGGENEIRIVGQGANKSLLRSYFQLWNGATPAPVPMTRTAFGAQSWRFGNNETPDVFNDGSYLRKHMERRYNTDIGGVWGFGCHDFAEENAFRDVVDMGTTSELRLVSTLQAGYVLASPAMEYVTEVVFLAGTAA